MFFDLHGWSSHPGLKDVHTPVANLVSALLRPMPPLNSMNSVVAVTPSCTEKFMDAIVLFLQLYLVHLRKKMNI